MKKLLAISLAGSSLFLGGYSAKADWDFWAVDYSGDSSIGNRIYTCLSDTGVCTQRTTKVFQDNGWQPQNSYIDDKNNLVIYGSGGILHSYDLDTDTWTDKGNGWTGNYQKVFERSTITETSDGSVAIGIGSNAITVDNNSVSVDNTTLVKKNSDGTIQVGNDNNDIDLVEDGLNIDGAAVITKNTDGSVQIGGDTDDIDVVSDGLNIDGSAVITKNADGSIQIGADGNDIDITAEGLTVDGVSLITKKESGEIHIGKNSLITKEEDGVQKLYAQDENGNAININVTNGSKLLIDGVEVTPSGTIPQVTTNKNNISTNKANIKNLGEGVAGSTALTAALSALPQTSKESKLSCGVGTGAYSSRYAVGFGCASKVNERVDVNAGGSYVFGGSKSYGGGTLDSGVVKAGFVFKLGELKKPTQISMKDKKVMETKIVNLTDKNEKLQNKVSTLMARLERLEKVALGDLKSKDLAVYKLK